jgi:hypothetical protein
MSDRTQPTSLIKTDQLRLYREILTLYCDYRMKHMALCACYMHNFLILEQGVYIAAVAL